MKIATYIWRITVLFGIILSSCIKDPQLPPSTNPSGITPLQQIPTGRSMVMYEINLRAFSANGTLAGILPRLDSIAKIGANVIWLMPIHPVGVERGINSPYCIQNYMEVAEEYGTLEDLKILVDEAHKRGIAVILDWVGNHTAWDHGWIEAHPEWYAQDGNGTIIHPPGTNFTDVAELNYNHPDLRDTMIATLQYWIDEAQIDGYRCDYADGVPFTFWRDAIEAVNTNTDRELIWLAEGERADHLDAGFDMNYAWGMVGAIERTFRDGQSPTQIFTTHQNLYNSLEPGKHWLYFTTNHDKSAWDAPPSQIFGGPNGSFAASVAVVSVGGIPLLYSSQEVGQSVPLPFFSQVPINWNANLDLEQRYQELFRVYHTETALREGENTFYPHMDVFAVKKSLNNEEVWILVNARSSAVTFNLPAAFANSTTTDLLTGNTINLQNEISLAPHDCFILKPE